MALSSGTAYSPVDFLDADTYVPFTEITIPVLDINAGGSTVAPAPAFSPDNALGGMSDAWLTYASSDENVFAFDGNGLCTAGPNFGIATYTVTSKITSVYATAEVYVGRVPNPDAQNKTAWCWAAAAKMVGENNGGGPGELNTGAEELYYDCAMLYEGQHGPQCEPQCELQHEPQCGDQCEMQCDPQSVLQCKMLCVLHSHDGVDFFGERTDPSNPSYTLNTADAGQRQIVMETHNESDGNWGGNNGYTVAGIELASLNEMSVGFRGDNDGTTLSQANIDFMNDELAEGRWVVARTTCYPYEKGHAIVVMSYDDASRIYAYWDPWTNEGGSFTDIDIIDNTIELPWETNNYRMIDWIQFCQPINTNP
jgi:hypothetical protein